MLDKIENLLGFKFIIRWVRHSEYENASKIAFLRWIYQCEGWYYSLNSLEMRGSVIDNTRLKTWVSLFLSFVLMLTTVKNPAALLWYVVTDEIWSLRALSERIEYFKPTSCLKLPDQNPENLLSVCHLLADQWRLFFSRYLRQLVEVRSQQFVVIGIGALGSNTEHPVVRTKMSFCLWQHHITSGLCM